MLKAMSKFQGVLKMFMLGMLKTILKTVLKYEKNTITLYRHVENHIENCVEVRKKHHHTLRCVLKLSSRGPKLGSRQQDLSPNLHELLK